MKDYIERMRNINIRDIYKKEKTTQLSSLYTSMILVIIIGIGVSVINTHLLRPHINIVI